MANEFINIRSKTYLGHTLIFKSDLLEYLIELKSGLQVRGLEETKAMCLALDSVIGVVNAVK